MAGVLNKIEIWPKEKFAVELEDFLEGNDESLNQMMGEAFALLNDEGDQAQLTTSQQAEYQEI